MEFSLIQRFITHPRHRRPDVVLGSGDDCAIVAIPAGHTLALSIDTLVEGTHFFPGANPYDIGHKAIAVSLSDAAAMGATPAWMTVALTLPSVDIAWIDALADGVFALLNAHQVELVGGNLTRGPLSITTQIHAFLPAGRGLRRSGAVLGDDLYVTGTLGDAALALAIRQARHAALTPPLQALIDSRFDRPTPRVAIGQALLTLAHSAIDLSDGLAGDLPHLLAESKLGAVINPTCLPLSAALQTLPTQTAQRLALTGGEDYELCFTAPQSSRAAIAALSTQQGIPITRIGQIVAEPGVWQEEEGGQRRLMTGSGFEHF